MKPLGRITDHLMLAKRMARATGCDVVAAHASGALDQADWAEMVQTCRGCGWAGQCAHWLDMTETAANAPEPCLNRARLSDLRTICERP